MKGILERSMIVLTSLSRSADPGKCAISLKGSKHVSKFLDQAFLNKTLGKGLFERALGNIYILNYESMT